MNDQPTVTIAIPTINRSKYLAEAIESCLSQTYQDFEIVISDNKSDDDTEQMVRSFNDPRIKYFRQVRRVPPVANWNRCVELASGEFITFLCDDDVLLDRYLEVLVTLIRSNNGAELARTAYRFVDESLNNIGEVTGKFGFPSKETPENLVIEALHGRRTLPLDGFICRTDLLRAVGGFVNAGFPGGGYSDHYACFQVAFHGHVVVATEKVLWLYRKHGKNIVDTVYDRPKFVENIPYYLALIDQLPVGSSFKSELEDAKKVFAERWQNSGKRNTRLLYLLSFLPEPVKAVLRPLRRRFG